MITSMVNVMVNSLEFNGMWWEWYTENIIKICFKINENFYKV
jgi:hypothetical protein